jgi:hypothetical protein
MKRVTDDLRVIQEELQRLASESGDHEQHSKIVDQLLDMEMISEFKLAVDNVRQYLWAYIELTTQRSGGNVDYTLQSFRLQRITEMLKVLREHGDELPNLPEARTFFEEITKITNTTVDSYYAQAAGAGSDTPKK